MFQRFSGLLYVTEVHAFLSLQDAMVCIFPNITLQRFTAAITSDHMDDSGIKWKTAISGRNVQFIC